MTKKNSQSKKEIELFQRLCTFFLTLSNSQNVLQCIKQVLTLHPNFNPFTLFDYISHHNTTISKKNLLQFMLNNNLNPSQDQIRSLLASYGYKDKLTYTEFLNYIYPFNTQVIRQISTVHIKKYPKTQKMPVPEQVICCFLMLLQEQLQLIKKLEVQKKDNGLKITREKLKRIFKAIKKVSQKQANHTLNSQNVITHLELRTFIRSFRRVQDHQFLNLGRRLSMGRQGIIGIDQLQFWIKSWKKEKKIVGQQEYNKLLQQKQSDPLLKRSAVKADQVKQNQYELYKSNLYGQLNKSLSKQGRQAIDYKKQTQIVPQHSENFINFIKVYLKYEKNIELLRSSLTAKQDIDIMGLFKKFDKNCKGVINAIDIQHTYYELGGASTQFRFQLLINKYSSQPGILSFSEFNEIFKSFEDNKKNMKRLVPVNKLSHQTIRTINEIILINLEAQTALQSIINRFSRGEAKKLFYLINTERSGFISYQELKNYLTCFNVNTTMSELMSVLKRFDRNKNGVIIEQQFLKILQK